MSGYTEEQLMAMSDEEIMNLDPSVLEAVSGDQNDDGDRAEDDATSADGASATEGTAGAEDEGDGGAGEEVSQGDADPGSDPMAGESDPVADKPDVETKADDKPKIEEFDYKAAYEAITAPFKANGKEMVVSDPADIKQLMQMGANYNKKMAALKPHLQLVKMLENNDLLDAAKLSFLIDLSKKDPGAIQKLVKESGLDPLDMDVEKANDYKPKTYTPDERELELDAVLEEIQDTPTYAKTVNLVSTKWDAASKQVVANNPQLLKIINDHMAGGIYDLISTELERERMLGRLTGMSDLQAYQKVGDAIQARGGFDHLNQTQPRKDVSVPRKPAEDPRLKDRRRAAGSTSANPIPARAPDFNPLAMSDAEFEKQMNARLL